MFKKKKQYILVNQESDAAVSAAKKLIAIRDGDIIKFNRDEWGEMKRGENLLHIKENK